MVSPVYPAKTADAAFTHVTFRTGSGRAVRAAAVAGITAVGILSALPVDGSPAITATVSAPSLITPMPAVPAIPVVILVDDATRKEANKLTSEEKQARFGEMLQFSTSEALDEYGMPVFCTRSCLSGIAYDLYYSADLGRYVCSCEGCKKAIKSDPNGQCWHLRELFDRFGEVLGEYLTVRSAAVREKAAEVAAAPKVCRFCQNSGTAVSGGSRYRCTCAAGKARWAA